MFTFVFGIFVGIGLTIFVTIHFMKQNPKTDEEIEREMEITVSSFKPEKLPSVEAVEDEKAAIVDISRLNTIINYLEDLNSPMKNISNDINLLYVKKESDVLSQTDPRMKVIIDTATINKLEKDFLDNLSDLKDHSKNVKSVAAFMGELSKCFSGMLVLLLLL